MMQEEFAISYYGETEARFREYLDANKKRFTPERRAILRAILSLEGHFSQKTLLDKACEFMPELNRTTVYRNIPEFEKCEIIRRTQAGDALWMYEHIPGHEHHDHMLCMKCGAVIEITSGEIEAMQSKLCKKYGFVEVKHQFCIQGICSKCQGR